MSRPVDEPRAPNTRTLRAALAVAACALGLGLAPAVAQTPDPSPAAIAVSGRPLAGVDLACDIPRCRDPEQRGILIDVTGLDDAGTIEPARVELGRLNLLKTGLFREVDIEIADAVDGLRVVYRATGHVIITDLDIEYVGWSSRLYPRQFATEIRKRLPLRRGGSFPPQTVDGQYTPDDAARVEDWQQRVVNLYSQQGYLGTRVRIIPEYSGPARKSARVVVRVKEGRQPELAEILVRGNDAFPYWWVVEQLSTGDRVDFWRDVFALFDVGRFARRVLKDELEQVERRYREEGFVTARVRLDRKVGVDRRGRVYPRVRVSEGPRLEVRFVGNSSIDDGTLKEGLTFAENGAIDETETESSREAIISAYQSIARYDVRVDARLERLDRQRYVVTFEIDEGKPVYVRRVEIVGNRQLSDAVISEAMETKGIAEDGVINAFATSAGVLQDNRVVNDLLAIRDLYRLRGLPAVRFRCGDIRRDPPRVWNALRNATEGEDGEVGPGLAPMMRGRYDVWSDDPVNHRCFRVLPDPDPRLVVLRVELEEGLRTTVGRLDIGPLLAGMDDQMQDEAYDLLKGLGFVDDTRRWRVAGLNRSKIEAVRGFLLRYYHQQGYLQAQVLPRCRQEAPFREDICYAPEAARAAERAANGDCSEGALYGLHLDRIVFDAIPCAATVVDGVLLRGNLRTRPHILANELVLEDGKPLGTDELFLSQANLRSLGIFDAVSIETIAAGETVRTDRREAAVVVTVEESDAQYADIYTGLQIDSTPVDEALPVLYSLGGSIRDENLWGRALEVGAGVNFVNRLEAPLTVDRFDETVFEVGPFFKDRRLFGTRLDLTLETTYKVGRTSQRDAYEQVIEFQPTIGYDFYNASYPADWGRGLRLTLTSDYRWERRRALVRSDEVPLFGNATQSVSFEPTLTWDRRDSPLHPTRGFLMIASGEIVFSAFSQVGEIFDRPSFKETLTLQYVSAFLERQLIVVPSFRIGAVQSQQLEADLKSGFFFKAGGDGVALPVRGYGDAVIEACEGKDDDTDPICSQVIVDDTDALAIQNPVGGKAMMLAGFEARLPTFVIDDFWWTAFVDAGAVAPTWSDMNYTDIFPSIGGGLRWLVTGQIPLRLDLAWPLREDPFGSQQLRVHLNIFYPL